MSETGPVQTRMARVYAYIEQLVSKYHRTYLALVSIFALLGYAFVLLFPIMIFVSATNIVGEIFTDGSISWLMVLGWFIVMLFSAQTTYHLAITKPVPAVGFTMPESKIPKVYELVQRLQAHYKRPVIHRIIITADYELDIRKTPRWMVPVWSSNTLIIGLPLLICLSPVQFEHMMARRIGQFSKQQNPVTNWLYQLSGIWEQYSYIYAKQSYIESKFLTLFYGVYASLYKSLSVHAARLDEMNADSYAMELYNHDDICEMITTDAVCQWYLDSRFWPAIEKAAAKTEKPLMPYRKLIDAVRSNMKAEKLAMLKVIAFKYSPLRKSRIPSMKDRLENIGHDAPKIQEYTGENAAEFFLGTSQNGALNLMDKLWFKNSQKKNNKKSFLSKGLIPALRRK